ncbi:MAG: hypothetical protein FK734_03005 [Asgard group archaeon]|nr:hypothetical protein [Asgard group archaeon]
MESTQVATSERVDKILDCLQNTLDFEILMYFVIYHELTLSKVEEMIPHKSRPTVYRHIQNLLEAGLIKEVREKKVRGRIPAKIYQLSMEAFNLLPRITPEQLERMSEKEKQRLYEVVRKALYPTISFMENALQRMFNYLQLLRPLPKNELYEVFEHPEFHLNLNFFSEEQYQLYIDEFQKFAQSLVPKILSLEEQHPEANKPFIYFTGLLPMRKIIDRIMLEKQV